LDRGRRNRIDKITTYNVLRSLRRGFRKRLLKKKIFYKLFKTRRMRFIEDTSYRSGIYRKAFIIMNLLKKRYKKKYLYLSHKYNLTTLKGNKNYLMLYNILRKYKCN